MGLSFTTVGPREHSHWIRVPRGSWPRFTVWDSRLHQPGGPGPGIYIPQKQGGPVTCMPSGTGFPFRRPLRLAGLRWRYSNPPPRGVDWQLALSLAYNNSARTTENSVSIVIIQQYFDCCIRFRCCGNLYTEQFPSDSPDIVDVFTVRYQATHVHSRDRCIATAIHATIRFIVLNRLIRFGWSVDEMTYPLYICWHKRPYCYIGGQIEYSIQSRIKLRGTPSHNILVTAKWYTRSRSHQRY
jgi:hypothetical protein